MQPSDIGVEMIKQFIKGLGYKVRWRESEGRLQVYNTNGYCVVIVDRGYLNISTTNYVSVYHIILKTINIDLHQPDSLKRVAKELKRVLDKPDEASIE